VEPLPYREKNKTFEDARKKKIIRTKKRSAKSGTAFPIQLTKCGLDRASGRKKKRNGGRIEKSVYQKVPTPVGE